MKEGKLDGVKFPATGTSMTCLFEKGICGLAKNNHSNSELAHVMYNREKYRKSWMYS